MMSRYQRPVRRRRRYRQKSPSAAHVMRHRRQQQLMTDFMTPSLAVFTVYNSRKTFF